MDQKNNKEWFDKIAHQDLIKAVRNSCLDQYDLLIIDEGQTLKLEWIKTLKDWIPNTYIFCDSSQSFSYEPKTMPEEIALLIDAQYHGILTAAIRTLPEVHDRLEKAIPERIQQTSLRDRKNGSVDERVVLSPINDELERIVNKLYNEGALPEHIAVVHNSSFAPEISDKRIKIDTSARIRGLEYPIVICVNISPEDEAQLINAYTRATTKLIAIYSISLLNNAPILE
jgi:superfamily I DNA and RNA helicase